MAHLTVLFRKHFRLCRIRTIILAGIEKSKLQFSHPAFFPGNAPDYPPNFTIPVRIGNTFCPSRPIQNLRKEGVHMLLTITDYLDVDTGQFLSLYQETIETSTEGKAYRSFYPPMYLAALTHILEDGGMLMVWEEADIWRSALLLRPFGERLFYIDSLETHPAYRGHGYAAALLQAVIRELEQSGPFTLEDCVDKENLRSLHAHEKAGFVRYSDVGYEPFFQRENPRSWGMRYIYDGPDTHSPIHS